jgi:hypothetical protein
VGSWLRRHLSYANVMATAAVFLGLAGTSVEAITALPANSVGTKQLKDGAVTSANNSGQSIAALIGMQGALVGS